MFGLEPWMRFWCDFNYFLERSFLLIKGSSDSIAQYFSNMLEKMTPNDSADYFSEASSCEPSRIQLKLSVKLFYLILWRKG